MDFLILINILGFGTEKISCCSITLELWLKNIYECRKNSTRPSFKTLAYVYQLESQVMKSNNKESSHNLKWRKCINNLE